MVSLAASQLEGPGFRVLSVLPVCPGFSPRFLPVSLWVLSMSSIYLLGWDGLASMFSMFFLCFSIFLAFSSGCWVLYIFFPMRLLNYFHVLHGSTGVTSCSPSICWVLFMFSLCLLELSLCSPCICSVLSRHSLCVFWVLFTFSMYLVAYLHVLHKPAVFSPYSSCIFMYLLVSRSSPLPPVVHKHVCELNWTWM